MLCLLLLEHRVRSLGRNAPLDKLAPGRLAPAQPLARLGLDGAARAPVRRTLHAAIAATLAVAARLTALLLCWLKVVPVFVSRAALTAPKVRRALHCAGQSVTPTKIHVKRKPNKQKVKKDGGKKWENSSRERKKWEKKVSELFLRRVWEKRTMDTVSAEQKRAVEYMCERRSVRHFSSTPIPVDVC